MKKRLLKAAFLFAFCVACVLCFAACGGGEEVSIDGTYYRYLDKGIDKSQYITLEGATWKNETNESGEAVISGGDITLYTNVFNKQEEFAAGKVGNGVLKLNIFGYDFFYCKEGKTPEDLSSGGEGATEEEIKYTVVFDANGGRFSDGGTIFAASFTENSLLYAPPEPVKDGCTLLGWSADKNSSVLVDLDSATATKDMTLYAVWSE